MHKYKLNKIFLMVYIFILGFAFQMYCNIEVVCASSNQDTDTTKYVTPEMYGAKGDGVTDDTKAIDCAIKSGYPIKLSNEYLITSRIFIDDNCEMYGNGTIIVKCKEATVFQITNRDVEYVIVNDLHFIMNEGISLERQQNLFYNDLVNLSLLSLNHVTVDMYGENSFVVTNSTSIEHYVFNDVTVNNLSTNSLGGCIWVVTKVDTKIEMNNCKFTQIPKDEIFAVANNEDYMTATITCVVNNCSFIRKEHPTESRGFSIRGWRGNQIYMQFNNCSFSMSNNDNMLSMSGKGSVIEMNNCNIVGNPQVCVFGGYETFDKQKFDYVIKNTTIITESNIAGDYEHYTRMASPNIYFEDCNIEGNTLFCIRNDAKSYLFLISQVKSCNINVDYVIKTQGTSYGIMQIQNSRIKVNKTFALTNTSHNSNFKYPLTSNLSLVDNIVF